VSRRPPGRRPRAFSPDVFASFEIDAVDSRSRHAAVDPPPDHADRGPILPPRSLDPIAALLADFTARQPIRTGSLIVTVFGDAILPRGGAVLLADLITLLEAFHLNHSQVRTALSRLVADGWLESSRTGRRSLYRLTQTGRHRFDEAMRRIYAGPSAVWRGQWHLVILPPESASRDELRKDLGWLGFGQLASGIMLHPAPDPASLASVIGDLPASERPLVVAGTAAYNAPPELLRDLVERCWDLAALARSYRQFGAAFAPLGTALAQGLKPPPLPALLARIMLIHDYRRIILRDPLLPSRLLPEDWIGRAAYRQARAIYRKLTRPAERWIDDHLHGEDGARPPPDVGFRERFR
jgi:phenylacetic acid degradation operon negative regulatory protein